MSSRLKVNVNELPLTDQTPRYRRDKDLSVLYQKIIEEEKVDAEAKDLLHVLSVTSKETLTYLSLDQVASYSLIFDPMP